MIVRRNFSRYDDTDQIKQMKDSDILAEKKRKQNVGRNAANAGAGMIASGVGGALVGGALAAGHAGATAAKGSKLAAMGRAGKTGALIGGIGAAAISGLRSANKANKQANENAWYNERLSKAQRQAKRRERKDWKNNITNREEYTY